MRYRLKTDHVTECEATKLPSASEGPQWVEFRLDDDQHHAFLVPLSLFEKTWEPVPNPIPAEEAASAASMETQLERQADRVEKLCLLTGPEHDLRRAAAEIRTLRCDLRIVKAQRDSWSSSSDEAHDLLTDADVAPGSLLDRIGFLVAERDGLRAANKMIQDKVTIIKDGASNPTPSPGVRKPFHHFDAPDLWKALRLTPDSTDGLYFWAAGDDSAARRLDPAMLAEYVAGKMLDPEVVRAILRARRDKNGFRLEEVTSA